MATHLGTFETRIQLKTDTQANWDASSIVPLAGEIIIYSADSTHNYSRLKVGDGVTTVPRLPFIDAGTIDGNGLPEGAVFAYVNSSAFPHPGTSNALYIDLSTNVIYCYTPTNGYTQLSNFTYTIEKTNVSNITYWRNGSATRLAADEGILKVTTGAIPQLNYETISVVRNVTKEGAQ